VRDRGITHLAKMLRTNSTLTDLNLATDNIGKSGAGALGQMLLVNGHLESLNLNGNSIGSQGASEIARALEHGNTRLESLSLDCTEIGEEFYLVLAQALRSPSCPLRLLSASRNNAGDKVAPDRLDASLHPLLHPSPMGCRGCRALALRHACLFSGNRASSRLPLLLYSLCRVFASRVRTPWHTPSRATR
jgi:hypothetical protein